MPKVITENEIEEIALEYFERIGYTIIHAPDISPDGEFPERFEQEIFRYLSLPASEFPAASKNFEQPVMDRRYFDRLADRFRSPHLWMWTNEGWKLRKTVFESA